MPFEAKPEVFGTYALSGLRQKMLALSQAISVNYPGRRLAFALRKLVLQNRLRVVDGIANGIKARFYPLDNAADRTFLFLPNTYDPEEFAFLANTLQPHSIFLDIGSNSGFYSLYATRFVGLSGKILAFEPNPVMIERLKFNIQVNGVSDKIEIITTGLADREMEAELSLSPTNLGASTIMNKNFAETVKIKCQPLLLAITGKIDRIDILKIDIEEADPLVMNAFFKSAPISLFPTFIIIETQKGIDFEGYGYQKIHDFRINAIYGLRSRL
jgi:FkbM family methyltransferase